MRKAGSAVVASVSALALAGCSAGHTANYARPKSADAIVVAATSAASSLDFTNTGGSAAPGALLTDVYETLVRIDDDGAVVPHLATSWQVSDDRTEYIFQLREGVNFSDGSPFTAETAAFSIGYVQTEWTNGLKSGMDVVAKPEALDEYTLRVQLKHPDSQWLWSMGTTIGAMMSPSGVDALATDPVGTGPLTVESFATGESIRFVPRQDYWGEPAQSPVEVRYFSDAISSINALQSGQVDLVWAMQAPELLDALDEDINVDIGTTNGEIIFSMNNQAAPFDDPLVRQAAAFAIDRAAANEVIFSGHATDTAGAPVSPSDPWFDEVVRRAANNSAQSSSANNSGGFYPHNPERARELLAESSYDGQLVTLTVPSLPYATLLAELLYSQLREVGFQVAVETVEFPAVWLNQVHGAADYQASIIAHLEARDTEHMFGNLDYYLGYDNARVRELFDAAGRSENPAAEMSAAIAQIMDDAGALTVANLPNIVLSDPAISGIQPTMVTDAINLSSLREAQ
ncbi:ABC transporter substrate-binding protein [Corynebacterium propinquum]|uniref:ABC transporter substrate-binding protein n=1 Tax=Corynebacterium propinquum TaxID=43769 RepID=A0AAP4BT19_9CORY|nr:ABC transporter substrate-binding protein [Corynebacterium propinquum]MDK4325904.1 ABC transporter substrate-binding protein [Corynebacterium propinquum]